MQDKHIPVIQYIFPKFKDIIFISIFIGVLAYGPRLFNLDGDLGRHITIGNYILNTGIIPVKDVFSHTMNGERLVPHEWLAQVIFALATNWMGLNGDVLLTAVIIGLTFLIKFDEISKRGTPLLIAAFVIIWAAAASSIHWLARPHIFTFLFLAIWTRQLEQITTHGTKSLWGFPLLMLVWANTHGAFIAGFVVWGVYFAEWLVSYFQNKSTKDHGTRLAIIGLSSLAVTFINPTGYHLWLTSLGYIRNGYLTSHTMEYMPPNFQNPGMWPFMLMLFHGMISLSGKRSLPPRNALLLAGWMVMSLFSMRNIPLFAIVAIPSLAVLLKDQIEGFGWFEKLNNNLGKVDSQIKGGSWMVMSILVATITLYKCIPPVDIYCQNNRYDPKVFPVNAVDWLKSNPQNGNVFNYFTWGGYMLLETYPKYTVFIDGQTDFYGESMTREYEAVISLDSGWEKILEKYNINWALIPSHSPLAAELVRQNWETLYEDDTAVILHR